jgi:serine/threonine protein phosphatase PrpC
VIIGAAAGCPACSAPIVVGDRYCEHCGCDLRASGGDPVRGIAWQSTTAAVMPCTACGETVITADGQCERCGRVRTTGSDRTVIDVPGVVGVTDRGRLRGRNEDALAVGRLDRDGTGVTMAVVCDGVSTSPQGDAAARAAVDAAIVVLLDLLGRGNGARQTTEAGVAAAAAAVAGLPGAQAVAVPPSCTYVSAIVTDAELTIGWVGDSRAYWLDADGATLLTVDDSPAAQLALTGIPVPGVDPHSVALLRWLGADAPDGPPHVVAFTPPGPGRLLLCSDGLSRYAKEPADLAVAVRVAAGRDDAPDATALTLTEFALDRGGRDNITVAVLPFPPPATTPSGG